MRFSTALSAALLVTALALGCKSEPRKTGGVVGLEAPSAHAAPRGPGSSSAIAPADDLKPANRPPPVAYVFRARANVDQLLSQLNAAGPWTWSKRDSEHYGAYVSTRAHSEAIMVKIYPDGDHFLVDIRADQDRPEAVAEIDVIRHTLLDQVLPSIRAEGVKAGSSFD